MLNATAAISRRLTSRPGLRSAAPSSSSGARPPPSRRPRRSPGPVGELGHPHATTIAATTIIRPATQNTTVGCPVSPAAMPPIAGPEHQAAHLRGAVQAEQLAVPLGRVGVDEVAAGGRVVHRRRRGRRAPGATMNAAGPTMNSGATANTAASEQADDHHRLARTAVGDPAEQRLAQQPGGRPRRDDDAERRQVHAVGREVDRQDRQERAEADPDGALRRSASGASGPRRRASVGRVGSRSSCRMGRPS